MAMSMNLCGIVWERGTYRTIPIAERMSVKRECLQDPRFRQVDIQLPSYMDHCAILSPKEALEFTGDAPIWLIPESRQKYQDGVRDAIQESTFVLAHIFEI